MEDRHKLFTQFNGNQKVWRRNYGISILNLFLSFVIVPNSLIDKLSNASPHILQDWIYFLFDRLKLRASKYVKSSSQVVKYFLNNWNSLEQGWVNYGQWATSSLPKLLM